MSRWVFGLLLAGLATTAVAQDIVRWTDEQGVVHFGNAYLAPRAAEPVELRATNGMDVPQGSPNARQRGNGGAMRLVQRKRVKNKDGWRGFSGRTTPGRRARR